MASILIQAVRELKRAARAFYARAALFLKELARPVSIDEDDRHREHILNIILILLLFCFIILGMTVVRNWICLKDLYKGIGPVAFAGIIIFYAILLKMSKSGYGRMASILLVLSDTIGAIYTGWQWGASLPATLLLTVLAIVIANALLGSTTGFITATIMIMILSILGIHESIYLNVPDWRYDEVTTTDIIAYSTMLIFISFIGWLSNKEIDASLDRARRSEKLLEVERDILEERVSERTQELVTSQKNKLESLENSVHIGELSRGIFHDLLSPLSAISLYIEEMCKGHDDHNSPCKEQSLKIKDMLEKTVTASRRMSSFMDSVKQHIKVEGKYLDKDHKTDVVREISIARDILAYKARMSDIHIIIDECQPIFITANSLRFHQACFNLISNAVEACEDSSSEKLVQISVFQDESSINITVSDTGCGMSNKQLKTLFTEPGTTKPNGVGVGLITVRSIIEDELGGTIDVKSIKGSGTTFIITIPINQIERTKNRRTDIKGIDIKKADHGNGSAPHPR